MNITTGSLVQYKKVGKAIVREVIDNRDGSAQVRLDFQTGPKDYKSGGRLADHLFWIGEGDVLELAVAPEPEAPKAPEVPQGPVTFETTGYGTVVRVSGRRFTTIYPKRGGGFAAKVRGMAHRWPSLEAAATELVELAR